jgi:Domain of unknown function (DU1801)
MTDTATATTGKRRLAPGTPHPFHDARVLAAFAAFPPDARRPLMRLRALIFDTAAATPGVGLLDETLKWGEPAYLTSQTRSGSTLRLGWKPARPDQYALYFNCQTPLVDTFRTLFPKGLRFEGNRALVFALNDKLPADPLRFCITAALTYHLKR